MHATRFSRGWIAAALFLSCAVLANAQQAVQPLVGAPLPGLSAAELARFELGKQAFAHSPTIAEGVGPIGNDLGGYNGGCQHCHSGSALGGGSTVPVTRFGMGASGPNPFDPMTALGGPVLQSLSIDWMTCLEVVPPQANLVT